MAAKPLKTEDFDSSPLGALADSADVRYSTNGEPIVVTDKFVSSTGMNGIGSGKNNFFEFNQTVTFTFAMPISVFAIDINTFDIADGAFTAILDTGEVFASVFDSFETTLNSKGEPIPASTGQFLGFSTGTPFTSLTISGKSQDKDSTYTLDTVKYVVKEPEPEPVPAPVPLPAGLPLLLAGVAALGLVRRR
ncbi:MAG: hypothetical protein DI533_06205 [Cereibacter sphaeroides]|uniref:VPLPA-CTERM sorting domain-containing protein n=1 Tax=Cereibacter sphaeroides TaxID=1063 RepID=A0A2W5TVP7_CERSP|nr:MAG: hypothetical protein DI533_06205 [Cereibacter sphaeroides]